jgi:RHS repeat-associated protein
MFRVEHISKGSWYEAPNRELNAVHGRWISPDPAGLGAGDMTNPQSWNRYAYVENDPLSAIDATGLGSDCPGGPNRNRSCNFHKPGGPDCVWGRTVNT